LEQIDMVKRATGPSLSENAFAKKALEAIQQIEEDAKKKKTEQLVGLREALGNIEQRIDELGIQRQQVENAIAAITGAAPKAKRGRSNHDELRTRLTRWLTSHSGQWYTSGELHREFAELEPIASIAAFLKNEIADGKIRVDKSGGNRNTKYTGNSSQ
jgi:hypothetical protein